VALGKQPGDEGDPGHQEIASPQSMRIPSDWLVKSPANFAVSWLGAPQWRYLGPMDLLSKTELRTRSSVVKAHR